MGGLVSGLFGGQQAPQVAPAPAPPTVDNSAAATDAAAERQRQAMLAGRTSTVLTGGQGVSDMGTTSTSKLLGSA